MTGRDIIDEINALVDAQLRHERSGYDHSINQDHCPHPWCDADFHGLPIKQRMQQMRNRDGSVDPEYRYADDTSPIICPGSLFEGEFTPPEPERPVYPQWDISVGLWQLPDDPLDPAGWYVPEFQFPRALLSSPNPFLPDISADLEELFRPLYEPTPEPEPEPVDLGQVDWLRDINVGWQPLGTIEHGSVSFRPVEQFSITDEQWQEAIRTDAPREFTVEFQVDHAMVAAAATGPWYTELIEQLHRRARNVNEGQRAA